MTGRSDNRRRTRREFSLEDYGELTAWELEGRGDNSQRLDRLRHNLVLARRRELTARQAEVICLRYEEDLTVAEIARRLGVNRSTVYRTLQRGRERLRKYLQYSL